MVGDLNLPDKLGLLIARVFLISQVSGPLTYGHFLNIGNIETFKNYIELTCLVKYEARILSQTRLSKCLYKKIFSLY